MNAKADCRIAVSGFLNIYFDGKTNTAAVEMDLGHLKLDSVLDGANIKPIYDGRVVSSISIDLPASALRALKKKRPKPIKLVFFDKSGKVVSTADVDPPILNESKKR